MLSPDDWNAIAELKSARWENELRRQQLLAHAPRQRPLWRRWTGSGLVRVGRWLTHWGERIDATESAQHVPATGY